MRRKKNLEEMADAFLAEHDPFYRDRRRNKGRRTSYSYLTRQQYDLVRRREIPLSCLGEKQAAKCADQNMDTINYRRQSNED